MERNTQAMRIAIGALVMYAAIVFVGMGQTPDLSNVTEADIQATIAHRNALHEQLIKETLPAASDDVKAAVDKAQNLQKEIDALAIRASKVPILEAELSKAHKAIWRDVIVCLGVGFLAGMFGPRLLGLASLVGV